MDGFVGAATTAMNGPVCCKDPIGIHMTAAGDAKAVFNMLWNCQVADSAGWKGSLMAIISPERQIARASLFTNYTIRSCSEAGLSQINGTPDQAAALKGAGFASPPRSGSPHLAAISART